MRGLVVPDQDEDFTADPVELFFDLAFVFAFSQLVGVLVHHPDWTHVGQASLVFGILWVVWSQVTWAANAVAGNSRLVRLVFLAATATSVPMAASVSTALDNSGFLFAIPVVIITSLGLLLAMQGAQDDDGRQQSRAFIVSAGVFAVLMLGGAALDDAGRVIAWAAAITFYVAGTLKTTETDWTMRAGHFAERHGLIIIVALGEVIVAVGKPLVETLEEGDSLPATSVIALIAAGVFGCLMWWAYFDRVQPALEHRVEQTEGAARSALARDNYTYFHLFIVAGVVVGAAGLEELTLHPGDEAPLAFRAMLFAGVALFLGGVGLSALRTFGAIARERVAGIALAAALLFGASSLDGVWLIVALDAVLLAVLAAEHVRIERPSSAVD